MNKNPIYFIFLLYINKLEIYSLFLLTNHLQGEKRCVLSVGYNTINVFGQYLLTTKITKYFFNLISLCVLRALRGDISLLLKQIRDCSWFHWPAKPSAPVTCDSICLPRSTRRSRRIYNQLYRPLRFKPHGRYNLISKISQQSP